MLDVFDNADDKLLAFNSMFNKILDKHAPVKTMRIRGRPNPYITDEIRTLMATRDNWKREFRQTKDPQAWSAYKNLCREVKHEIRMAEKEFVSQQIRENPNNTNSMWKAIKSCIPKKSATNKTYSKDSGMVANEFDHFFATVGKNTAEKVSGRAKTFQLESLLPKEYPVCNQFSFDPLTCNKVEKIINSMASNKAPGLNKIPIHVVKDCLPAILPSVTSIVNATFNSQKFPTAWKTAEVVPILKARDPEIPSNNRPISLLPTLSKVCERAAHDQLTSYLQTNQLLSSEHGE